MPRSFKIKIIGDAGVGKSSLRKRFTDDKYPAFASYIEAIDDSTSIKKTTIKGNEINLQIVDDFKNTRFRKISESSYRGTHAIIIVYDPSNKESFENAIKYYEETEEGRSGAFNAQIILVETKSDINIDQRKVDVDIAKQYAKEKNILFMQVSAENNVNVTTLFETISLNLMNLNAQSKETISYFKRKVQEAKPERTDLAGEFSVEHKRLFDKSKAGIFGFLRKTNLKADSLLSDILQYAKDNNNRSRQACVNLGWMNIDGTLATGAPEEIKLLYQGDENTKHNNL